VIGSDIGLLALNRAALDGGRTWPLKTADGRRIKHIDELVQITPTTYLR
jgi:hypothetical protein